MAPRGRRSGARLAGGGAARPVHTAPGFAPAASRTLGQGLFSLAVRDAYQGGEHRIDNGLLLRSDFHRLYDRGYVTVTPDYVFRVGDSLRDDFQNGRSY